jgi:hypothetical protein
MLAAVPLLILASMTVGVVSYVSNGVTIVHTQHATTSSHTWPKWPIRRVSDVIRLDGPEEFAPVVSLRWTDDSAADARAAVLTKYGLTPVSDDGPQVQAVRMSDGSTGTVRGLINEPIVADTDGIDRSQSRLPWATYPLWQKLRFSNWWLRFRVFMGVSEHANAGEAVAAVFYTLPIVVVLVAVPWLHRYVQPPATPLRLVGFGLFGVVTAFGLMRSPYEVRAVDDVVIPAILFGCCVAALWRTAGVARGGKRVVLAAAAVILAVFMVKSVAVAGEFADRMAWLAGDGRSMPRMEGAWRKVRDRLLAEPPLAYWNGMRKPAELQAGSIRRRMPAVVAAIAGPLVRSGDLLPFRTSDGITPLVRPWIRDAPAGAAAHGRQDQALRSTVRLRDRRTRDLRRQALPGGGRLPESRLQSHWRHRGQRPALSSVPQEGRIHREVVR